MSEMSVSSFASSSASPEQVWQVVRDFCAPWHPAIETMTSQWDDAGGLTRVFTVKGENTIYKERLTYHSNSERVMVYGHVQGIDGVDEYTARLAVAAADDGGSVVTMSAQIMASTPRLEGIAQGTKAIFDEGVTTIVHLAEQGAGAEKTPAVCDERIALATQLIGDLPRLAISHTPRVSDTLVLFLHGIGGNRGNWAGQLQALGGFAFSASLDLRGYGDSSLGAEPSTIDAYCDDILRVMDEFGVKKLVLCGLSYGAWIATSFAMRYPDMLSGLVLSGGCTGMSEAGHKEREAFRISREVPMDAGQSPADFAPAVVDVIAGPNASDAVRGALFDAMGQIPTKTYRDALRCFTNPPETFDFAKLTMPVLLMTGEHDRLAPPDKIKQVSERIWGDVARPDVRFEVLPDAGHVCNLEEPEIYNHHLAEFVKRFV